MGDAYPVKEVTSYIPCSFNTSTTDSGPCLAHYMALSLGTLAAKA